MMDSEVIRPNDCLDESLKPPKEETVVGKDEDDESNSLLSPQRGQISKRPNNSCRKVQWNDRNGFKLVEILEFQPSDSSDSDEEDESDSCICAIM